MKDFEDAVQTETAKQNNIEIIVTRNKTDYKNSGLNVYNTEEYMVKFMKGKQKFIRVFIKNPNIWIRR